MAQWICKNCRCKFIRDKSGIRRIRFCSNLCYWMWQRNHPNRGQFKRKHNPWNKNLKGIHLSPKSEWKKGQKSNKFLPIGTITIRKRKRDEKPRSFIKIGNPSVWIEYATYMWEKKHKQKVPKGYVIHHKDRDSLNNNPRNLQALTRAQHIAEHRHDN